MKENKEYVEKRNTLIPLAVKTADRLSPPRPPKRSKKYKAWAAKWNSIYHAEMNRLYKVESEKLK